MCMLAVRSFRALDSRSGPSVPGARGLMLKAATTSGLLAAFWAQFDLGGRAQSPLSPSSLFLCGFFQGRVHSSLGHPPSSGPGTSLGSAPGPEPELGPAVDLSSLPVEVWLQILIHVPPRTLVTRCRAVCRQWRTLVDGPRLWRLLWAQAKDAPSQALLVATHCCPPAAKPCSWARLGVLEPLARNLLQNTCGEEGFRKWKVKDGGHGWKVEQNLRPVPGAPAQTCFASSFRWCQKRQVVNLLAQGLWPELLDDPRAEIHVSDWWGARSDCGSKYWLHVRLVAANGRTVLARFDAEPEPIPCPNDNPYLQVSYIFTNFPNGVRYIIFEHAGKDTQFWAGHYGARVTHSCVKVYFRHPLTARDPGESQHTPPPLWHFPPSHQLTSNPKGDPCSARTLGK